MPDVNIPSGVPPVNQPVTPPVAPEVKPLGPHVVFHTTAVVVLLIAIAVFFVINHRATAPTTTQPHTSSPVFSPNIPASYKTTSFAVGEYPPGFPKVVALDGDTPLRAEDTFDTTGQEHKIIEYIAAPTPDQLYVLYQQQLPLLQQAWSLQSKLDNGHGMALTFQDKSGNQLTIMFTPYQQGSRTVAYVRFDFMPPLTLTSKGK